MNDDLSRQTQLAVSDYWRFLRAAVNRNSCNAMIAIISLPDLLCHVKWFKFICPTTEELLFKVTEHSIQFGDVVSSSGFLSCSFLHPPTCLGHSLSLWEPDLNTLKMSNGPGSHLYMPSCCNCWRLFLNIRIILPLLHLSLLQFWPQWVCQSLDHLSRIQNQELEEPSVGHLSWRSEA